MVVLGCCDVYIIWCNCYVFFICVVVKVVIIICFNLLWEFFLWIYVLVVV